MATIHRLNSDWTLTDGIIDPIRLDRPMSIYAALRAANLVPDAHYGLNIAACEWLYNRAFVYEKKFDLPPSNDTERTELHFDAMYGNCTVSINGTVIQSYAPGCYDITAAVRPADNLLSVSVAPEAPLRPFAGDPLPARGISGIVSVQGTNRITLHSAEFSAADGLVCDLQIDAHISGKYHFTCVVSRDGEAIATHEAHERLIAAPQHAFLRFPLPAGAEGMYDVLLTIEHNGLLCDQLRRSIMIDRTQPGAVCHIDGDTRAETEASILQLLPLLKQAGFDGVAFQYTALRTRRVATRMQELGLFPAAYDAAAPSFTGCMSAGSVRKYASGAPVEAAWRLRHSDAPDWNSIRMRFGEAAERDETAARLYQAQHVFDALTAARMANVPLALRCCADAFPRFGSAALADGSDARPALHAAAQALSPLLAIAQPPEAPLNCGQVLKIPVLLLSRNVKPLPVTVTAAIYAPDGSVISSVSFSAMPGSEPLLGELNCNIPAGTHAVLLRTAVEQPGEAPIICDSFLPCGEDPLLPADMPAAFIDKNTCGDTMACGVVTARGIRYLLPGESAAECTGEWLNHV